MQSESQVINLIKYIFLIINYAKKHDRLYYITYKGERTLRRMRSYTTFQVSSVMFLIIDFLEKKVLNLKSNIREKKMNLKGNGVSDKEKIQQKTEGRAFHNNQEKVP